MQFSANFDFPIYTKSGLYIETVAGDESFVIEVISRQQGNVQVNV